MFYANKSLYAQPDLFSFSSFNFLPSSTAYLLSYIPLKYELNVA